jgi:hypothetical protein
MEPLGGSGVSAVMPATRSAAELTQAQWWSELSMITGRSGTTASSQRASNSPSGASAGLYALPTTHGADGLAAAKAPTVATTSSTEVRSCTSAPPSSSPAHSGWGVAVPEAGAAGRRPRGRPP